MSLDADMKWYRLGVVGWLLAATSCGIFKKEKEVEEVAPTAPRLVGRVAMVNEPQRFVLVEGFGEWKLGEGLLLSSIGGQNERAASLFVSGERMGRFTAADWKSGEVKVGDQVYARPLKVGNEAAAPTKPLENGNNSTTGETVTDGNNSGSD